MWSGSAANNNYFLTKRFGSPSSLMDLGDPAHLVRVRQLHEKDLAAGFGRVYWPNALERKPRANRMAIDRFVGKDVKGSAERCHPASLRA